MPMCSHLKGAPPTKTFAIMKRVLNKWILRTERNHGARRKQSRPGDEKKKAYTKEGGGEHEKSWSHMIARGYMGGKQTKLSGRGSRHHAYIDDRKSESCLCCRRAGVVGYNSLEDLTVAPRCSEQQIKLLALYMHAGKGNGFSPQAPSIRPQLL